VHLPIDEPKEWVDRYAGESDQAKRWYGACVSHLDAGVGRIVQALTRSGQLDNTLIIFLSDNGGSTGTENNDTRYVGTHPSFRIPALNGIFRGKKATLYEGGIRTPAFVFWSGKLKSRVEATPMHVADWFPTLAGLTGYRPKVDLKWDGMDLWPVLCEQATLAEPRTLYWAGPGGSFALRHGDLILIRHKGKADELYDLASDPRQQSDLAATQPQRVRELAERLQRVAANDNDARVKEE
jgi:arylsulfatase A-like enzyme